MSEHPRKPGRYRVRLVDDRAWLVDAEAIGALPSLREGTPLEAMAVEALERAHRFIASLDRALGAVARARRSRRELGRKLARLEPDAELVERVLARLEALGLLDDADVARAEARSRLKRGEGAGKVRQSLMRKGVDRSTIDTAVREVVDEESIDDGASCRAAAEKRMRALRAYAPDVQRRRLTGFLLRRGFSGAVVSETVRAVLRGMPESDE